MINMDHHRDKHYQEIFDANVPTFKRNLPGSYNSPLVFVTIIDPLQLVRQLKAMRLNFGVFPDVSHQLTVFLDYNDYFKSAVCRYRPSVVVAPINICAKYPNIPVVDCTINPNNIGIPIYKNEPDWEVVYQIYTNRSQISKVGGICVDGYSRVVDPTEHVKKFLTSKENGATFAPMTQNWIYNHDADKPDQPGTREKAKDLLRQFVFSYIEFDQFRDNLERLSKTAKEPINNKKIYESLWGTETERLKPEGWEEEVKRIRALTQKFRDGLKVVIDNWAELRELGKDAPYSHIFTDLEESTGISAYDYRYFWANEAIARKERKRKTVK